MFSSAAKHLHLAPWLVMAVLAAGTAYEGIELHQADSDIRATAHSQCSLHQATREAVDNHGRTLSELLHYEAQVEPHHRAIFEVLERQVLFLTSTSCSRDEVSRFANVPSLPSP